MGEQKGEGERGEDVGPTVRDWMLFLGYPMWK